LYGKRADRYLLAFQILATSSHQPAGGTFPASHCLEPTKQLDSTQNWRADAFRLESVRFALKQALSTMLDHMQ
jgi:hypothetical protein